LQKYATAKFKDFFEDRDFLNSSARPKVLENFLFRLATRRDVAKSCTEMTFEEHGESSSTLFVTKSSRVCMTYSAFAIQSRAISQACSS